MGEKKTILVAGAAGNIGQFTLDALRKQGYSLIGFDLDNKRNRGIAEKYPYVEWILGDIQNERDVERAVSKADAVINLIAILPPQSEMNGKLTNAVNVGGVKTIIEKMKQSDRCKHLVFTSSAAVHGVGIPLGELLTPDSPYKLEDYYADTKAKAEQLIMNSDINWTILRLTAAPNLDFATKELEDLEFIVHIGLNDPVEFCHPKDVGLALANAATRPLEQVNKQIFMIGSGPDAQFNAYDFVTSILKISGVGKLPKSMFSTKPQFPGGWVDSSHSQAVLQYQKHTFAEYLEDLKEEVGPAKRFFTGLVSPMIRMHLKKVTKAEA